MTFVCPRSICVCVLVAQSCPTLCYTPMDRSVLGSSVHEILQARILDWVAISFSRGSSQPRDQTQSPTLHADSLPSELQGKWYNHLGHWKPIPGSVDD